MGTRATKLILMAAAAVALNFSVAGTAAATELNCTAGCNSIYAGALWQTVNVTSTGTGVINSFVRIDKANNEVVDGHNTGGARLNDELNGHTFDRQLSVVPILDINGTLYYEFLLDINQAKSDPLLALNNVQICLSQTASLSQADGCPTTPSYTMGTLGGGPDYVALNYTLNNGSGSGDLFMYIPVSTLGTSMTDYVYLFSQFGAVSGYENNAGFEEWATRICGETYGKHGNDPGFTLNCATPPPPPVVPEPGTLVLFGTGLAGLAVVVKRRRS